jgi:hypothetical protein
MAIAYVNSAQNAVVGGITATTIATTVTGLTSGNTHLVIAWFKHEGDATNLSASDGSAYTNVMTGGTAAAGVKDHTNNDVHAGFFVRSGFTGATSVVVTGTLAAARPYITLQVFVYSYTATDTITIDDHDEAIGSGTTPTSPDITTTGTDVAVVGGMGEYASFNDSNEQINALAASHVLDADSLGNYTLSWDRLFASTFTGHANVTIDTSSDWICSIVAMKAAAAAAETVTMDKWHREQLPPKRMKREIISH